MAECFIISSAMRYAARFFSAEAGSKDAKEHNNVEQRAYHKTHTGIQHSERTMTLSLVSDSDHSDYLEFLDRISAEFSVADRHRALSTLHIAVEAVRQRLEILDQTAPLRILQSQGRCRRLVWSVEGFVDIPLSQESVFYANLAIAATSPFEAWDTASNGTLLRFADCSTIENIRNLHAVLKSNLSLYESAVKGVIVKPFTDQQKQDFLYPVLASLFDPATFSIVRLIRPVQPKDFSTFLHEIAFFSFLPSSHTLSPADPKPPPLPSLSSHDGLALYLHRALLTPAAGAAARSARLTLERELMNALSRWRVRHPRLFPAEVNPHLRADGPPRRMVCAGDLFAERARGRTAPEWSIFALTYTTPLSDEPPP